MNGAAILLVMSFISAWLIVNVTLGDVMSRPHLCLCYVLALTPMELARALLESGVYGNSRISHNARLRDHGVVIYNQGRHVDKEGELW